MRYMTSRSTRARPWEQGVPTAAKKVGSKAASGASASGRKRTAAAAAADPAEPERRSSRRPSHGVPVSLPLNCQPSSP